MNDKTKRVLEMVAAGNGALVESRVRGIALNTSGLSEADARREIERMQAETGLPVTDPVRFGADALADCIVQP